jgi:hypothetical protein
MFILSSHLKSVKLRFDCSRLILKLILLITGSKETKGIEVAHFNAEFLGDNNKSWLVVKYDPI